MRRREFIAGLGGAAAWPVVARGQPGDRVRRIGAIMGTFQFSALTKALADLGWTEGRDVRIDLRLIDVTSTGHERSRRSWSAYNRTSS